MRSEEWGVGSVRSKGEAVRRRTEAEHGKRVKRAAVPSLVPCPLPFVVFMRYANSSHSSLSHSLTLLLLTPYSLLSDSSLSPERRRKP